jgi:hypothetical protein
MKQLTIAFQYGNRDYIEQICRKFLNESLTGSYEWIQENCTDITIGKGFNKLVDRVKTEYVLWTPDDFAFFPNGNWVNQSINILKDRPDIGIIDLRKEQDGETPWMVDKRDYIGDQSFLICRRWADRRFNLTPFIARTKDIKKILPLNEQDTTGNIAEADGYNKWNSKLLMARLDIPFKGVCFHMGWNRSRYA